MTKEFGLLLELAIVGLLGGIGLLDVDIISLRLQALSPLLLGPISAHLSSACLAVLGQLEKQHPTSPALCMYLMDQLHTQKEDIVSAKIRPKSNIELSTTTDIGKKKRIKGYVYYLWLNRLPRHSVHFLPSLMSPMPIFTQFLQYTLPQTYCINKCFLSFFSKYNEGVYCIKILFCIERQ